MIKHPTAAWTTRLDARVKELLAMWEKKPKRINFQKLAGRKNRLAAAIFRINPVRVGVQDLRSGAVRPKRNECCARAVPRDDGRSEPNLSYQLEQRCGGGGSSDRGVRDQPPMGRRGGRVRVSPTLPHRGPGDSIAVSGKTGLLGSPEVLQIGSGERSQV